MEISLSDEEVKFAETMAQARLTEQGRRQSPDRPTSRNPNAQRRGAVGEIAAASFLEKSGCTVVTGYEEDRVGDSDLTVDGIRVEVMTAQRAHREKTGFCVPPNKLWAARQRGAIGYLFVGTGPETSPRKAVIQGGVILQNVDADPARETFVSRPENAVNNHVIREEHLLSAEEFVDYLRGCST